MCGLAGVYSTNFQQWEYDAFNKLLLINVFRGWDSTGVIRVQTDGRIAHFKTLEPSPQFLSGKSSVICDDDKSFKKPYALLGHTRAATKGAVTVKNAHPFNFKNVIGMHNGTIHTSFKHKSEYETDSEAFYRNLNDYGLKEALEEIEAYDTAYAFQFIDKKKRTLNFIKNSKRPLYFTYAYAGTTLLWTSDRNDLEYVLKNKKYSTNSGWKGSTTDKVFTLHDNHLFSIPLGSHPQDDCSMEEIEVKKKYHTYTTTYRPGSQSGTRTGTVGSVGTGKTQTKNGVYGEWVETQAGWRFVEGSASQEESVEESRLSDDQRTESGKTSPKQSSTTNPPSTNSSESLKKTSITTEGTEGRTRDTPATSTGASQKDRERETDSSGKEDVLSKTPFARTGSFRDAYGTDALKTLAWLDGPPAAKNDEPPFDIDEIFAVNTEAANDRSNIIPFEGKKSGGASGGKSFRGFQDRKMTESEFRFKLGCGCFCCGEPLSLDNPHDFAQINNIHWWGDDLWACDYCFAASEGDWVRRSIEDDWGSDDKSVNIKK